MDKQIAKQLREISDMLPLVFEHETETVLWTGADLNLTPYGDKIRFEANKLYPLQVPVMRAVEHRQQVKDAFKRDGMKGVNLYIQKVVRE